MCVWPNVHSIRQQVAGCLGQLSPCNYGEAEQSQYYLYCVVTYGYASVDSLRSKTVSAGSRDVGMNW